MTLRRFLLFTAFTLPACGLLILFFDQPLARFIHGHFGWAVPFFAALTATTDGVHEALMTHVVGLPLIFLALGLAFAVGYARKQPGAALFLILLLTHECSMVLAKVLKGTVHRLRPEVQFGKGYAGVGLWQAGAAHNDSFPSSHTAVYFSLFLPLAVAFPRWRVPLLVLPALIGIGRLVLGMHYLSDVWFSVWLAAGATFLFGLLAKPLAVPNKSLAG